MPETKELKIQYNGKEEVVVIKKMGFAEKNTFMEKFVVTEQVGTVMKVIMHPFEMRTHALQTCIKSGPFPLDIDGLNTLDDATGDYLFKEIDKFNKLTNKKKENSLEL